MTNRRLGRVVARRLIGGGDAAIVLDAGQVAGTHAPGAEQAGGGQHGRNHQDPEDVPAPASLAGACGVEAGSGLVDVDGHKSLLALRTETHGDRVGVGGGELLEVKLKRKVALTLADIKQLLTGATSKGWKLDGTPGANAIIVGTEGNPAEYFGGGPLADCQLDDVYTFTTANAINYNANGATFNGGNIAPNYNCGSDRSYNSTFTFAATTGGVAGIATVTLPGTPLPAFIGTTDVPDNTYRIIEISPTRMTLRAGSGSGTVFQFKMVAQ